MRKTNDTYIEQLLVKHNGNIVNIEDYYGAHYKILHKCNICDNEWKAAPGHIVNSGTGCPKCGVVRQVAKQLKTHAQYLAELENSRPDILVIGQYLGAYTKITHKCKICEHLWEAAPHNLKGCPAYICVNKNRTGYYSYNNIPDTLFVYLIKVNTSIESFYKVGVSISTTKRFYSLKEELPNSTVEILKLTKLPGSVALLIEKSILTKFIPYSPKQLFGGHTECLSIDNGIDEILQYFNLTLDANA